MKNNYNFTHSTMELRVFPHDRSVYYSHVFYDGDKDEFYHYDREVKKPSDHLLKWISLHSTATHYDSRYQWFSIYAKFSDITSRKK